jgi:hypothetical protein
MVAASTDPDIPEIDFDTQLGFAMTNLFVETPAFGSAWSYSYGNAAPTDDWIAKFQAPATITSGTYKDAWTFTFTNASITATAFNIAVDPKASAGGSGVAVAAFGAANSCYPGLDEWPEYILKPGETLVEPFRMAGLSPALDNVAIATSAGDVSVDMAIENAWATFGTENTAFANEMWSESRSWASGTAIADFNW